MLRLMFLKCQKSQKNTWNILLCLIFQLLFAVFYYVLVVFLLYSISQKVQWKTFGSLVSQSVTHWQCGPKRYILEQLKKYQMVMEQSMRIISPPPPLHCSTDMCLTRGLFSRFRCLWGDSLSNWRCSGTDQSVCAKKATYPSIRCKI